MKALVLYDKGGKYGFEPHWPEPEQPDGWAIVKVAYCGICGSDLPRFASAGSYHHPMILGHEFSGYIEKPSRNSTLKKGDKVAILPIIPCGQCEWCRKDDPFHCKNYQFLGSRNDGGFAEYCAVPEANLFRLPEEMDVLEGSLIEPMLVALNTVRRSGFTPGKSAIVFGAGPIGLLVACWLRVFGASRVVVSDLREFSRDIARKCGFTDLYDPLTQPMESVGSFDFAFEAAGSAKALQSAISLLNVKGVLTVVGRDAGDTVIPVKLFEQLMRKELTICGCWGYKIAGEEAFLYQVLKSGQIPAKELVTHFIPPEDSPSVLNQILQRKLDYCKAVVDFVHSK